MTTPAGTYTVLMGFWPGGEGKRLKVTRGPNDGTDRVGWGRSRSNRPNGTDTKRQRPPPPRGQRRSRRAPPSGADRRVHTRVMVDIEVDYKSADNFLFAYITDISAMGIFIRTDAPEPPGTVINLRFHRRAERSSTSRAG